MESKNKNQARLRLVTSNGKRIKNLSGRIKRYPTDQNEDHPLARSLDRVRECRPQYPEQAAVTRVDAQSLSAKGTKDFSGLSSPKRGGDPYQRHIQVASCGPMLAKCYLNSNSILQADRRISLLDHKDMAFLRTIKALRRENMGHLLDAIGQTPLSEITEISAAYLYQMGKATGKSLRNVSDDIVIQLESRLGIPRGWMDVEHPREDLVMLETLAQERMPMLKQHKLRQATKGDGELQNFLAMWPHLPPEKRGPLLAFMEHLITPKREEAPVVEQRRAQQK